MSDNPPTAADVVKATPDDLTVILGWLKSEYDEDGAGFWSNREIISRALGETDDLWVIRRNGEAIAFQVGDYAADIVSVRKDHRQTGMGTALFEASLARARRDDVNVLRIQCAPENSLQFWEGLGFRRYRDRVRPDAVMVRRILPRTFDLPPGLPRAEVVIGFYPEAAQYHGREDVAPIAVHRVAGARLDDGSIMLERRVLGLLEDEPEEKDLAIKVEVDGEMRCFCKAKYEAAEEVGVRRDRRGGAFFVDLIESTGGDL